MTKIKIITHLPSKEEMMKHMKAGQQTTLILSVLLVLTLLGTACTPRLSPPELTATVAAAYTPTPMPSPTPAAITPDQDLAALIQSAADGEVLTLAPGTFSLAKGLLIDKNLTLMGSDSGQTILTAAEPAEGVKAMVVNTANTTLTLQNLGINYSGSTPSAVLFIKAGSLVMDNCTLSGATLSESGNQLGLLSVENESTALVRHSRFIGNPEKADPKSPEKVPGGIFVSGNAHLTLEDSLIDGSYIGVYAYGSSVVTLTHNEINNTYAAAAYLEEASGEVTANTLQWSTGVQLGLFGNAKVTASENIFNNADGTNAIQVNGTAVATLLNNTLNGGAAGIVFGDNSTGQAVNNHITLASGSGIFVNKEAAPTLDSNLIESCEIGILYQDNAAGSAVNNTIFFGNIGLSIKSPASPSIAGNTIQGYLVALASDPEDWITKIDAHDNSLTDGEPEIIITEKEE